jgi:uncharacterized protein YdiU (UPF0061 family)
MSDSVATTISQRIGSLEELAKRADYSFVESLRADPQARDDGQDHDPRQVFSGHFVPVTPTPIDDPEYVAHSHSLFSDLQLDDGLATDPDFIKVFSGDLSQVPDPMRHVGWATGYALSIFGREYYHQCPFQTGNGYGDGRAISVLEGLFAGQRWEMQLKGGGRTPYCRGGDGRAVLRSSVREFLAQEHMHALGIPTSRSLSLYASRTESVRRPWYSEGSFSFDPDRMGLETVAISTRVAPSFIRVGQLELFGRRARKQEHPEALKELEMLVLHLIQREYAGEIDEELPLAEKLLKLAELFRSRLTSLVANWIRVGYCQGNFNGDNCAAGGFTLDYGPFGFCEQFDPNFQPWTGGGEHFAFMNQPVAAARNYQMFLVALLPLVAEDESALDRLQTLNTGFSAVMQEKLEAMWSAKLGLIEFDKELLDELLELMSTTPVDYTKFFRALSNLPEDISALEPCFYVPGSQPGLPESLKQRWTAWLAKWRELIVERLEPESAQDITREMKAVNPKYILREWFVVPTYQAAYNGDYEPLRRLQTIINAPYAEQNAEVEAQYDRLKPEQYWGMGGVSHYSCSS